MVTKPTKSGHSLRSQEAGVPTPKFGVATTADEAKQIAADLNVPDIVVKVSCNHNPDIAPKFFGSSLPIGKILLFIKN